MLDHVTELTHLVARWVHLIAGIMWIGNSMLWNWIDRNLEKQTNAGPGHVGTIFMVHSGGFYEMEKKYLAPGELPRTLHWFKWQNGITWLSGISLLILVYYLGAKTLMVDPDVADITPDQAVLISAISLPAAFLLYDRLWRSSLGKKSVPLATVGTLLVVAVATWVFFRYFSGRAAYMHVGVLLGTMMTGNVWFVIIPSQRELIAATMAGRDQDPAVGYQAKERSVHNNYFTFPLLFIMISGHFPSTFSHPRNWLVLLVLALSSAGIRWCMNMRFTKPGWLFPAGAIFISGWGLCLALLENRDTLGGAGPVRKTPVHFSEAAQIIHNRCTPCHSANPTDDTYKQAPNGVMFDTPEQIISQAAMIEERAVKLRNMPLANITQMKPEERAALGAWVAQGAKGP